MKITDKLNLLNNEMLSYVRLEEQCMPYSANGMSFENKSHCCGSGDGSESGFSFLRCAANMCDEGWPHSFSRCVLQCHLS